MGRLMIRLLGFPLAAQVIWRYGMLARIAKYILHFSFYLMGENNITNNGCAIFSTGSRSWWN